MGNDQKKSKIPEKVQSDSSQINNKSCNTKAQNTKEVYGILLKYPTQEKKNDINRICPSLSISLEKKLNALGNRQFTVFEKSIKKEVKVVAHLVVDYSSGKASYSDNLQSIIEKESESIPNVGLIILRQADENQNILAEIQNQLPFDAFINSKKCAFKLLVKNNDLNDEGNISRKNLSLLCNLLLEASETTLPTPTPTPLPNVKKSDPTIQLDPTPIPSKKVVYIVFPSTNKQGDILRMFPEIESQLKQYLPDDVNVLVNSDNPGDVQHSVTLLVDYSSSKASFTEGLDDIITERQKRGEAVALVLLRQGTSDMKEELQKSLQEVFKVEFGRKFQFYSNKFVNNDANIANLRLLADYAKKKLDN